MSHRLYQTEALILGSRDFGEANRLFYLFAPHLGLAPAAAQGVRNLKSKLRCHLQDLTHAEFTLIRGREYWRIAGCRQSDLVAPLLGQPDKLVLLARICRLLRQLIRGEGDHRALFGDLKEALVFLAANDFAPARLSRFELLLVSRLLYHLGYLELKVPFADFLTGRVWQMAFLDYPAAVQVEVLSSVNRSLHHSQL